RARAAHRPYTHTKVLAGLEDLGGRRPRPGQAPGPMNIAVIGAGWAGLSAALELHRMGHGVTVFEAGHRLGGRARGLHSPRLNATLDNGQHIMLGAYTETLALMRRLGLEP